MTEPAEGVVDKPTKRRESALLAGAIRGATWLGSVGKAFPSFLQNRGGTTMPADNKSEIVIFKIADEKISVDVRFEGETVWLTQAQLVDLYGSSKANVSEHIKHIFEEEELEKDSVVRNFRTTENNNYNAAFNLL